MPTRPRFSESEIIEQYRVSLDNAEKQTEIASALAELGYDAETIAQGKALFNKTRAAYDANKIEDDETAESYQKWANLRANLADRYALDRKKAKVIFRNDEVTKEKLAILGTLPKAYVRWLETVKKFYSVALNDDEIQSKLARLKITPEHLTESNQLIADVENARADYLRELGESQDATKAKDAALAEMDDWMRDFYAVAKIALDDRPQLMEALGKFVRS
ncbi:hypothetical protein ACT29H_09055 [Thermophagus sp. OGC60D27]|uniref:hypothetical protein n=1 Tax=Thermophagus sp. OGC60D27 TaxID=3458415 RepID=UPI00403816D1